MRVIRLGPAELVVVDPRPEGAVDEVLQLAAAADVADHGVELPVGAEAEDAAVVVAAERLAGVCLEGTQPDQIPVGHERRAGPAEAIDAVAEERDVGQRGRVGARRARSSRGRRSR